MYSINPYKCKEKNVIGYWMLHPNNMENPFI